MNDFLFVNDDTLISASKESKACIWGFTERYEKLEFELFSSTEPVSMIQFKLLGVLKVAANLLEWETKTKSLLGSWVIWNLFRIVKVSELQRRYRIDSD